MKHAKPEDNLSSNSRGWKLKIFIMAISSRTIHKRACDDIAPASLARRHSVQHLSCDKNLKKTHSSADKIKLIWKHGTIGTPLLLKAIGCRLEKYL